MEVILYCVLMVYEDILPIALAILTSIITGGFVLVFVEIGNRKNRENDRHEQIMTPFYHKLSAFFRFISWGRSYIIYPKPLEGYEEDFKELVKRIGDYGGRAITSGGDYEVDYFSAEKLNEIALDINNIWYFHDKMHPCRLGWQQQLRGTEELFLKDLKEVNPVYLKEKLDVSLLAKVSGEFYTDIYQLIEYETYKHEAYQEQYKRQTCIVVTFVCLVLLLLGMMLFVKLPELLLQLSTALVILMLMSSLLMLSINIRTQIKWWNKIDERMSKLKPNKENLIAIKEKASLYWRKVWNAINAVFSFLLSKAVLIGLLLSGWAIFSIEITCIPRIPIEASEATVAGMNKVFLALSYSYVAGVIIYWFTVVFPGFLHKRKMAPIVAENIDNIGAYLYNMLIKFCAVDKQMPRNPKLDDLEDCKDLLVNNSWSQFNQIPPRIGARIHEVIISDFKEMQEFIDTFVNDYSDVMSTRQLLLIEKIRHSSLGSFLDFGGILTSDFSVPAKEKIAEMFCDMVKNYNELKV